MHPEHLDFSCIETSSEPFDYFLASKVFCEDKSFAVLEWVRSYKDWQLVRTDFYEQYEFSLSTVQLPNHLDFLSNENTLSAFRNIFSEYFEAQLSARVDVAVHKLLPGQTIKLHNDYLSNGETHRIVIQINEAFNFDMGGLIMLFNSPDPSDVYKIIQPLHNSALGFIISQNSNHAVSQIHKGERYSLVYSFFE